MEYFLILFIVCISVALWWLNWQHNKSKDFRKLIEPKLEQNGLKYVKEEYPGIFKVGPFKKFEIEIGKPQINKGTIQYEKTYYRKITAIANNKKEVEIWAKIDTSWFKEDSVEFNPKLKNINKASH
ncbi:hypothetical protein FLBR109950_13745 [Flavobacterium branchiophilum]|uniref:Uncharacterized protein n=1 Tax=Flavobacterium branchiophilum (strain FL-15) TaxID=1034807 RepID=G2Z0X0_FLABF|nr:hypothetical protein [Flavobacterium branchiophilum]CCB69515.1 Hypothetical protein FBFL15_1445 [Flavobacterium branchiophilum FL-15]